MYPEFSRTMAISCLLDGIKHNEDEIVSDYIDMELSRVGVSEDRLGIRFGRENLVILNDSTVTAIDISGVPKREGVLQRQVLKHQILNRLFPENFPDFIEGVDMDASKIGFPYVTRERVLGNILTDHRDVSDVMEQNFTPISMLFEGLDCPLSFDPYNPSNFMRTRSGDVKYVDVINQVSSDWNCDKLTDFLYEHGCLGSEVRQLLGRLETLQFENQESKRLVLAWE